MVVGRVGTGCYPSKDRSALPPPERNRVMGVAGTAINAAVVAAVGLILWLGGRGRFEAINRRFDHQDGRFDRLEERLDRRVDGLETRMDAMRADLQGRMDAMRADLQGRMDAMRSDL